MKPIQTCPICRSRKVERVTQDVQLRSRVGLISVPDVEFDHCRNCGESFYGPQANEKIDAAVAAAKRRFKRRKSA